MSYGWMLLVVAVVAGAIYSTAGERCVTTTTGFSSSDVQIKDFGTSAAGELKFNLRNSEPEPIEVQNITVRSETSGEQVSSGNLVRISALGTETSSISGAFFQEASGCNTMEVKIIYDREGIQDQIVTGQFTSKIRMGASQPPASPTGITLTS